MTFIDVLNTKIADFAADPDKVLSESADDLLRRLDVGSPSTDDVATSLIYFVATYGLNQLRHIPLERMLELIYRGELPETPTEIAVIVSSALKLDKFDYSTLGGSRVLDFWTELTVQDRLCTIAGVPDIVFDALKKCVESEDRAEAIILALVSHMKSLLKVD